MAEDAPDHDDPVATSEPAQLFRENGASWYWLLAGPAAAGAMLLIQISSGIGADPVVPLAFLILVSGFIGLQVKAARIHTSVVLTAESLRQGTETIAIADILAVYPKPTNTMRSYYDDRALNRAAGMSNALSNRALKKAGVDLDEAAVGDKPAEPTAPPTNPTEKLTAKPTEKLTETDEAPAKSAASVVEKWQSARALGELAGVPRGRTGIGLKLAGGRTAQAWARRHDELRAVLTPLVEARAAEQSGGIG